MNLSFAGCGFLGIYHVGVAVCFKKYAPHLLLNKISGASAGALAACSLLCDLPIEEMTSQVLRIAAEARQRILGPFSPSFNINEIMLEHLRKFLPDDAHLRVNGKLHISVTRVYDGKNMIVSQFSSKEDLMQVLLATTFVPFFSGLLPPRYHGVRYMDGGFSDNLPTLDDNTITVSPFCGESDICPRDISSQLLHVNVANTSIELSKQNIYRCAKILFPPKTEILSSMCKQGFDDALRFLHRNNLLKCTRCLAVQSTFVVSETLDESMDPECLECKLYRQEALEAKLPETVLTIFQNAIDNTNDELINWFFKHRIKKLLSLLNLPCTLLADIVYAIMTRLITNVRQIRYTLMEIIKVIFEILSIIFPKINIYFQLVSPVINCQLNITEYGTVSNLQEVYEIQTRDPDTDAVYKKQKNLYLTLQYNDQQTWNDSRKSDCLMNDLTTVDDTFDSIFQASSDQKAVIAYYYMDDNNKVQVMEIFDVTDSEWHAILSIDKTDSNDKLEFDDWDEHMYLTKFYDNTKELCVISLLKFRRWLIYF